MTYTAIITSKGQITIPSEVRKILNSSAIEIEVIEGEVRLRPVASVAGKLAKYVEGIESEPFTEVRKKVWTEVAREKKQ
jgi:AbrB family looped-hinge helix DNA binding protein